MEIREDTILRLFDLIDTNVKDVTTVEKLTDAEKAQLFTILSTHYGQLADQHASEEPAGANVIDAGDPYAELDACPTCGQLFKDSAS